MSQQIGDLISREETLTAFSDYVASGMSMNDFGALWDIVVKMPPANPWIPVSDRLPEENETVMASTEYGVFPEARYTKEYGWEWAYEAGADYWKEFEGVTAWMPLPKPYEPQQESESKRYMELAKSYVQGVRAGLAESEE